MSRRRVGERDLEALSSRRGLSSRRANRDDYDERPSRGRERKGKGKKGSSGKRLSGADSSRSRSESAPRSKGLKGKGSKGKGKTGKKGKKGKSVSGKSEEEEGTYSKVRFSDDLKNDDDLFDPTFGFDEEDSDASDECAIKTGLTNEILGNLLALYEDAPKDSNKRKKIKGLMRVERFWKELEDKYDVLRGPRGGPQQIKSTVLIDWPDPAVDYSKGTEVHGFMKVKTSEKGGYKTREIGICGNRLRFSNGDKFHRDIYFTPATSFHRNIGEGPFAFKILPGNGEIVYFDCLNFDNLKKWLPCLFELEEKYKILEVCISSEDETNNDDPIGLEEDCFPTNRKLADNYGPQYVPTHTYITSADKVFGSSYGSGNYGYNNSFTNPGYNNNYTYNYAPLGSTPGSGYMAPILPNSYASHSQQPRYIIAPRG